MATYHLTYATQEGDRLETEWFDHLQHAIVRMLKVEVDYLPDFTGEILYDNQDVDGQLYDVLYFSSNGGFEFSMDLLPLPPKTSE